MPPVDRQLGEYGEQEARSRLERALLGTGKQLAGYSDLGLDMLFQYPAPTRERSPLIFAVQVKTGDSFAEDAKSHWRMMNLGIERLRQWQKAPYPVLFIWVRPTKPAECYWAFINKNTGIRHLTISKKSQLSPTAPFDFAWACGRPPELPRVEAQLELLRPPLNLGIRPFAKQYYTTELQGREIDHPVLGTVEITRNCWNHLTRKKRPAYFIAQSLQLLPFIPSVVEYPNEFAGLRRLKRVIRGGWITDVRLHAFRSLGVPVRSRPPIDIVSVVRESIVYPTDWLNDVTLHKKVKRTLVMESIYEKVGR